MTATEETPASSAVPASSASTASAVDAGGARPVIVDLSVPVDPEYWEPEPVRRKVIGHREGADLLGRSYAYLRAPNRLARWVSVLLHRLGRGVNHRDFPDGKGLSLMHYTLTTHTGTHMDAPWHYGDLTASGERARTICEVPLDWCHGDGVLLDLRAGPADQAVTATEIAAALGAIDYTIKPLDIVLLWTGGDTEIGTRGYFQRFRGVTREATAYLVERGVKVIGVDSFGFDAPFLRMLESYMDSGEVADLWPAHLYGREAEYCQLERLTNLGAIGRPHGFRVSCFPVKLAGGDAGWTRVVAHV
ncbi:kynurenine formamidase [Herbihabitans rhizosphaerae]|uniref:Kynurenine formamidase n=1 Tax=Herbihabitans rhizosphaerae TaxID=1872711 RepID=A0A4Q7KF76_9PSEU|nr:cyclase family protein [Herbihabitans rhizosphaerae]RZS31181.1 kynurenine formamidase [Herbihabitans rhizosphaerae]